MERIVQNRRFLDPRGGGTLIFSYILRLGSFFFGGGVKILNFNIFGGFQKYEYFWGYEDFLDILGGLGPKITCMTGSEFGVITKLYYI